MNLQTIEERYQPEERTGALFPIHTPSCRESFLGPWLMDDSAFHEAFALIEAGRFPIRTNVNKESRRQVASPGYRVLAEVIAVIDLDGPLTKGVSKFEGTTSTTMVRRALRNALVDLDILAIIFHIDSPGGAVDGIQLLADEVAAARGIKPIFVFFENLGASAAYWIGSQGVLVYANRTAGIGSIGVVAVVEDSSERVGNFGVKVHVVSTGEYKGAFQPGAPVKDSHLAYLRDHVNTINEVFLDAIQSGRGMTRKQVQAVADGRVYLAPEAKALGLIDEVGTMDDLLVEISSFFRSEIDRGRIDGRRFEKKPPERAVAMSSIDMDRMERMRII